MKKIRFILVVLFIATFVGCNSNVQEDHTYNEKILDFIEDYMEKNSSDIIYSENTYDEQVVTFENTDHYGIASFYEDEAGDINHEISLIEKSDDLQILTYSQIKGKSKYYIGVFIDDEEYALKTSSTKVNFSDNLEDEPYAIQVTSNNSKAQIISYAAKQTRKIESIQLLNDNSQVFYEAK